MQDPVPLVSLSRGGAPSNAGYDAIVFRYAVWLGCWSGLLRDLCMALLTRSHRSWGSSICFVSSYAAAHHSQNQGHIWVAPLGLRPPHDGPALAPLRSLCISGGGTDQLGAVTLVGGATATLNGTAGTRVAVGIPVHLALTVGSTGARYGQCTVMPYTYCGGRCSVGFNWRR